MGLGQVDDVDVVAKAGAVRGRVVVSEDGEALTLADGSLGDERDEVVGHSAGQLADKG